MTTVGELWLRLNNDERNRVGAALTTVLPGTGMELYMAIMRTAHRPEPQPADWSPHLFAATPEPPQVKAVRCYDCDAIVVRDPMWWVLPDETVIVLGSTCWRRRILHADETAGHEAPPLPIDCREGP